MFYWRSKVLENWGRGWIVVDASDPDAARYVARREFDAFAKEEWHYLDSEELAEKRALFEVDISDEPVRGCALFVKGSE